ncbi:MAG: gamma-glutamylcyclotransferase [Burkholderiales bacterium]
MTNDALKRFIGQLPASDLWIFGYGSLMWNPGFRFVRKHPARLFGFHRALCIHSTDHRGTRDQPGLVMGLAPGGSCHGIAFRVSQRRVVATLRALWQRELCEELYSPRMVEIRTDSQRLCALAFVVARDHARYAGRLTPQDIACRVAACRGVRGSNIEYLSNTVAHLRSMGVRDRRLAEVMIAVGALDAARDGRQRARARSATV